MADTFDLHEYLKKNHPWAFYDRPPPPDRREREDLHDDKSDIQPFESTTSYPWGER